MSSDGVVYRHSVEALLDRVLRQKKLLTPELTAALLALGVDPDRPRDLPMETWRGLLQLCAARMFPALPEPDGLTEVGRTTLDGFTQTLVGRGALMLGKMAGPARSLAKLADTWATANSVYRVTSEQKGPKHFEVRINVGGAMRYYNRGILLGALEKVGVKNPVVGLHEQVGGGDLYVITWS